MYMHVAKMGVRQDSDITSFFTVRGRKRPSPSGQEEPTRQPGTEDDQDTGNDSTVAVHRPATTISKSKYKQGKYVSEWESEFSWVYPSGDKKGMYCCVCVRVLTLEMSEMGLPCSAPPPVFLCARTFS